MMARLVVFAALAGIASAANTCGPTDTRTKELLSISLKAPDGEQSNVQVMCLEDAAEAAARYTTARKTKTIDAQWALKIAKELKTALQSKAADYKLKAELDSVPKDASKNRVLTRASAYSRRAHQFKVGEQIREAVADILRGLIHSDGNANSQTKLLTILGKMLEDASSKAMKAMEDGDLVGLLEALDIEDDGVTMEINKAQLKRAYRDLSVKYHPDKNPGAGDRFKMVRDSYEILSDPVKAMLYDTGGMELVKKMEKGGEDLERSDNSEHTVKVPLAEVYTGSQRSIRAGRRIVCRSCRLYPSLPRCKKCQACPSEIEHKQVWMNQHQYMMQEQKVPSKEKCLSSTEETKVNIEKGMQNGDKVTMDNMASQLPKKVPGDVIVTVQVNKHPVFQRIANDLVVVVEVSLYEALLGFERELEHLDGHIVKFGVPQGAVLQPQFGLTIEGEGMPLRDDPTSAGRLLVRFQMVYPSKVKPAAVPELEKALKSMGMGPLPKTVSTSTPVKGKKRDEL